MHYVLGLHPENLHFGLVEASLCITQVLLPRATHTAAWAHAPPPHTFAEGTLCVGATPLPPRASPLC